ncbi:MAG: class I SAM-dependent methyltransferase [Pseudomonadota bacterium]
MNKCRMCKSDKLTLFLDLGFTPPADSFLSKDELQKEETYYPLQVFMCETCGLAQLGYVVPKDVLYRNDYPYESSMTSTGRKHWGKFAADVSKKIKLCEDDLVVDIGSNVGVLLLSFKNCGARVLGVDPAENIVKIANKNGIDTVCDFFGVQAAERIVKEKGQAKVITGTNVFAHIDDLDDLMKGVNILLRKDGMFVFEVPYLVNLICNNEYDTIYHEHLSYISVKPLIKFFDRFDMEIFDIIESHIHGGSIRVFVNNRSMRHVSVKVQDLLKEEERISLYSKETLLDFAARVSFNRSTLFEMLFSLNKSGKKIVAVSAPAKGMTLLNYCNIDGNLIDFVTEKSTLKIGRYTPGKHIPVVPDSELVSAGADYALLLAWNFADEIIRNLDNYRRKGGKFIIPIPMPKIVE